MTRQIPARTSIPVAMTWDAASVFASDAEWEDAIAALKPAIQALRRFEGQLANDPQTLATYLGEADEARRRLGKVYLYASLFASVDTNDQVGISKRGRVAPLMTAFGAATAFDTPEIAAMAPETLEAWCSSEPALVDYRHHFEMIQRRKAHTRSAEVESLLAQVSEPFRSASGVHGTLVDAELPIQPASSSSGERHSIGQGTVGALTSDADPALRRSAWENYADAHLAFKNTMATCLVTSLKQSVFGARTRNYASSLHASLESGFIPVEVFHNLIDTYRRHLPIWHRYWRVRRRAMGQDVLHQWDVKAPLAGDNITIPYDQAIGWISEGMAPLGADYVTAMQRGLVSERWVDVYPNVGKRAGAFSTGVPGTYPFILMNYNDDIYGVSTLAHELGHSMHSYLTNATQPFVYARHSLFTAEVASNFNQVLVRDHLLKTQTSRELQIAVLEEAMSNFHRYFFIMPALSRFELETHQRIERGQALTADDLSTIMADFFEEGFGGEVEIDRPRLGITWAQFSTHLYMDFYTYQYATGISGAHALGQQVLDGAPGAVERYLTFLRAGISDYPLELLKAAGVDLSTPAPVETAFGVLDGMVTRLAELTGVDPS